MLLSDGCGPGGVGGGAFAWKCESPPEGDDSSGAAELRMVVRSIKYATGIRTIQRDLDVGIAPSAPAMVHTDAAARGAERMAKSSRWLAARYAMIRCAERCNAVRLLHIPSVDNCADIMTKCITGKTFRRQTFRRHRARVLGIAQEQPATAGEDKVTGAAGGDSCPEASPK